jgi:hypothetical protein
MDMKEALRIKKKADAALIGPGEGYKAGMVFPIASRDDMDPDEWAFDKREGEVSPGQKWAVPDIFAQFGNSPVEGGQMIRRERAIDPARTMEMALDFGAAGLGASMLRGPGKGAILGANVWQGGPHKYGPEGAAESLQHMGKGEGAQAYGWGRYDAQNKAVADDYYKKFSDPDQMPLSFKDKPVDEIWNDGIVERWGDLTSKMTQDEVDDFTTVMGNLSQVNKLEDVGNVLYGFDERQMRMYRDLVEPDLVKPPTDAHLYKHDLPDEDIARYLDWDKPLSEQPESVRAALEQFGHKADPEGLRSYDTALLDALYKDTNTALPKLPADPAGEKMYWKLVDQFDTGDREAAKQAASEALGRAGIPGLKYLDQGSRVSWARTAAPDNKMKVYDFNNPSNSQIFDTTTQADDFIKNSGTRNYVTWDQDVLDRMKLLERNGENMALPMDEASRMAREASRMARADEMFPIDAYHGTSDDVVGSFNLDHPNRKDTGWLGTGVYSTSDPQLASMYPAMKSGTAGPNVMPLRLGMKNPYQATLAEKQRLMMIAHNNPEAGREAADLWTRELQAQGYDGVMLKYDPKDVGAANASTEYVVFDPKNVRSRFAKFDPARADSPDLLASMTGSPELAMLANTMRDGEPDLSASPAPVDLNQYGWNKAFFDQKIQAQAEAEAERKRQGMREALQQNMQRGLMGGVI